MIVQTTVETNIHARQLAERIIEERLAACVQIMSPLLSVYRWQGRLEHAEECLLVMKTPASRLAPLISRLQEIHPYELPEIISWPAQATPEYAAWCTRESDPIKVELVHPYSSQAHQAKEDPAS